ncbi:hypothetical protein ES706_04778 [subsurface metagenome]
MKTYRLENRTGHFKFYELWAGAYVDNATTADKAFVGTRHGRIGTEGQTTLKDFEGPGCKAEAYKFLQSKIKEKLARGYEMVSVPATDEVPEVPEPEATEQLSIF